MLAPFSPYLQSNQAPSEDEACEIKTLVANRSKEISIIDVEIDKIEDILKSLKQNRAHIQNSIDDCNAIFSAVHRLPVNVLGVIFYHCLATHRDPIMSSSDAPILLTHICRDWRSIALSIPRLWSRFYIPFFDQSLRHQREYSIPERERRMEIRSKEVQRWLELSADCPLSITMKIPTKELRHPPLVDAILQSSQRWQRLELKDLDSGSDVLNRLLSLSADDLSMLRELRLHALSAKDLITDKDSGDLWCRNGLLNARGLRSICIAYMHSSMTFPGGIPPNWKNLNHLIIHSPIALELANRMLRCCCNLLVCVFEISELWARGASPGWNYDSTNLLPLPHLIHLTLRGDLTACNELAYSIKAPSLRTLDYRGFLLIQYDEFGLFKLLQSINSLQTLRLDRYNLSGDNALRHSILSPSVTHLVFRLPAKDRLEPNHSRFAKDHDVKLINALYEIKHQYSPDSVPTVLFPLLEVFEAYDFAGIVSDTLLLKFIMARIDAAMSNTGVSKLRKVVVEFDRTRQIDIAPQALDYARAAGIELEIDLTYLPDEEWDLAEMLSPSYGLFKDDISWPLMLPLYDF
jgi:hypothetical protein